MAKYYLVAPTRQIGGYWARELGLRDVVIIDSLQSFRGYRFPMSKCVIVEGEPFGFPELAVPAKVAGQFYPIINMVEDMFRRCPHLRDV